MFDTKEEMIYKHKQRQEEELLEIFMLIEENTMQTKVQALMRYAKLYNIKDKLKANDLMKETYAKFNGA